MAHYTEITRNLKNSSLETITLINELVDNLDSSNEVMAKMQYNHEYERKEMSRVIRRLVNYADRVAERHPQAVTIRGQNARVEGGIWLAKYDRETGIK